MSPAIARPQAEHKLNGVSRGAGASQATQWVGKTSSRKATKIERSMAGLYRERRPRANNRHDGRMGCGRHLPFFFSAPLKAGKALWKTCSAGVYPPRSDPGSQDSIPA